MCRVLFMLHDGRTREATKSVDEIVEWFRSQAFLPKYTPLMEEMETIDGDYHQDGIGFAYCFKEESKEESKESDMFSWKMDKSVDMAFPFQISRSICDSCSSRTRKATIMYLIGHLRHRGEDCAGEVDIRNTHPFQDKTSRTVFCHNGKILDFIVHRHWLRQTYCHSRYERDIQGETDSELIFYMLLTLAEEEEERERDGQRWKNVFQRFHDILSSAGIIYFGNFVVATPVKVFVTRLTNHPSLPPCSLYYDRVLQMISSEPLPIIDDDDDGDRVVELVPPQTIIQWDLSSRQIEKRWSLSPPKEGNLTTDR